MSASAAHRPSGPDGVGSAGPDNATAGGPAEGPDGNQNDNAARGFIDTWLAAEPWHRLPGAFEPAPQRPVRQWLEALGYQLRSAALDSSDSRVSAVKLPWWHEEMTLLGRGQPRHPLTRVLAALPGKRFDEDAGRQWLLAAARLAVDASDADLGARLLRWQAYALAQQQASAAWLPVIAGDADLHGLALLAERLPAMSQDASRGRLPLPLTQMARHGLDRSSVAAGADNPAVAAAVADYAGELSAVLAAALAEARRRGSQARASGYRRSQARLAQLLARHVVRQPQQAWSGRRRLPGVLAALAVWRVSGRP
ncbi:MAG: hypothetical protein M0Q42_12270 [Xanthomonadales bacterium]|nr:hypothetical protein [Xanthomonadales bacterium]